MPALRRIILVIVFVAALAALLLAVDLLVRARHWDAPQAAGGLDNRLELYSRRVDDMQTLVMVLLGLSGLYSIVFIASTYTSAQALHREAGRALTAIQDQLGMALGELRELQEAGASKPAAPEASGDLARIYQDLAQYHSARDTARARGYLQRSLALAPSAAEAAEVHYDLACLLARDQLFAEAAQELETAFETKSSRLERKLTHDIEEDGALHTLASTPPFDAAITRLLMNVSVGSD